MKSNKDLIYRFEKKYSKKQQNKRRFDIKHTLKGGGRVAGGGNSSMCMFKLPMS